MGTRSIPAKIHDLYRRKKGESLTEPEPPPYVEGRDPYDPTYLSKTPEEKPKRRGNRD